ncbi:MAG: hypothetical protein ACODAB_00645 [Gemmatimonadota bacterium]
MQSNRSLMAGLAAVAAMGTVAVLTSASSPALDAANESSDARWTIEATEARIIGGYGDNFDYAGENVRPLDGSATMTLDAEAGMAQLEINVSTTDASGPIRFSEERSFEGDIRIVQRLNTDRMERARIATDVFLHGDTRNEAPVMPKIYNYFATWGPAKIWVNGEEAVPMIGSHTMFTEQARGANGRITNSAGEVYSPRREDKTGFTDPDETEFHFVAHTTEPDSDNFPPHTAWIHLHFSNVDVLEAGDTVPYER